MKIHAIEATTEVPEIEHENQLHLEHYRIDEYQLHYIDNGILHIIFKPCNIPIAKWYYSKTKSQ